MRRSSAGLSAAGAVDVDVEPARGLGDELGNVLEAAAGAERARLPAFFASVALGCQYQLVRPPLLVFPTRRGMRIVATIDLLVFAARPHPNQPRPGERGCP
jgi:hypothetical protein